MTYVEILNDLFAAKANKDLQFGELLQQKRKMRRAKKDRKQPVKSKTGQKKANTNEYQCKYFITQIVYTIWFCF